MFSVVAIALVCYTAFAVATGRVCVKSGIGVREILRIDAPVRYWIDIAIYASLSASLAWLF